MKMSVLTIGVVMIAWGALFALFAPGAQPALAGEDLLSRPGPPGEATGVSIGILVIDISKINNTDQSFTADFVTRLKWRDPRLAYTEDAGSTTQRAIDLDEIWHPEIQVLNDMGLSRLMDRSFIAPDGTVTHLLRYYGELRISMDFRDFPWDKQRLAVKVISLQPASEVALTLDADDSGRLPEYSITDWDISGGGASIVPWTTGVRETGLLLCEFSCAAKRHPVFFFVKVILTVTLIFFMAWAVFWIDPSQVGPQISISTSSVFTLIAFQFTLGYLLPPIPYLTRLDRFTMGVTVLVFVALGEAITTTMIALRGRKELSQKIDRWARVLFLLAFGVVILIALI